MHRLFRQNILLFQRHVNEKGLIFAHNGTIERLSTVHVLENIQVYNQPMESWMAGRLLIGQLRTNRVLLASIYNLIQIGHLLLLPKLIIHGLLSK